MDVLELCIKATIRYLNGDYSEFHSYRSKAIDIYEEQRFKESCMYSVESIVPGEVKEKLYEMVS